MAGIVMSGFLVLGTVMMIVMVPAYAASTDSPLEQYQSGIPIGMIQCNDGKLLMMTSAGKPVCVTSDSALRLAYRDYATVYQPDISQKANAKSVTGSNNNDEDTSADDDAVTMDDGITTKMQPSNYTRIAATNNQFAIDFYRQISDTPENIFFSPVSMYLAFSILYEGAGENTAQEMQDVFGFEPDKDARHNSTSHFISSINQDDPYIELNTANALWIVDWFEPYDSYTSVARETYLSTAEKVNFLDADDGVKRINQWASDNTNGKIEKVIAPADVNELTAMVINNAIYFKGTWKTQFPEEDTAESAFWKNSEDSVDVDFMTVLGRFDFGLLDNARMLKMPYDGDRLSMLVILPDDTDGLKHLEDSISHEQIRQWTQNLYNQREVLVSIPKFQIAEKYILNEPLMNLGMPDVFSPDNANLGGIADISSGNNLYVTAAIQDTFIDVNEEGTEAAAVTTIISARESLPPPPPQFIADHPFLFIIQDDESGTILFMGKISDP